MNRHTVGLGVFLMLFPSCGSDQVVAPQQSDLAFPTFEPFTESRMWKVFYGDNREERVSPTVAFEALSGAVESTMKLDLATLDVRDVGDLEPEEQERLAEEMENHRLRGLYSLLPGALIQLEPLWEKDDWTKDERALGGAVASIVHQLDPEFSLNFGEESDSDPAMELRRLVVWFREQVEDPMTYGRMILTFDDGPWLPSRIEIGEHSRSRKTQSVDGGFELELFMIADVGWCLRGRENDEIRWTVNLDHVPRTKFDFTGTPPTSLGSYGWKIHMSFGEYTQVYLSPEKELLFYFTSW